jgi:D-lactate dehydrogenase
MRIAFFDTQSFERPVFEAANAAHDHAITFFDTPLTASSASLARGHDAVCIFVNDRADAAAIHEFRELGIKVIALRSAGFNHVNLAAAAECGIAVVRVPEYSPHAVAEHAMCLILALNRKIHRAYVRVRELNFSLDGLMGFDLFGATVGVIGTGRIGRAMIQILNGFGAQILVYDPQPDKELVERFGVRIVELSELYAASDVITLHCPLLPETQHLIGAQAFAQMKPEVILINTGRGALIDTKALITALKTGRIGGAGLDVYEEEEGVFFHDLSTRMLQDDVLARLLTFPNVLITSHQGFLTREALRNIASTTLANLSAFERGEALVNAVRPSV